MKFIKRLKMTVRQLPWWWANAFQSAMLRRAKLRCQLRTGIEPVFQNWADWSVFTDIFVEGDYDEAIRDTLATASGSGPVVVADIGANVGFFTLRFLHLRRLVPPQVRCALHQFEANPATYRDLTLRLNRANLRADFEAVHPHLGAVGERNGTIWIAPNAFHAMTATNDGELGGTQVPFIDVEQALGPVPIIHLLKCDIEGGENGLIKNYETLLQRTQRAIFEFHLDRCDHQDLLRRLQKCGLECQRVIMANQYISLEYFVNRALQSDAVPIT